MYRVVSHRHKPIKGLLCVNHLTQTRCLCLGSSEDEDKNVCLNYKMKVKIFQNENFKPVNRQVGAFVVFHYDSHLYPGVIKNIHTDGAIVSAMQKSVKAWRWPEKED
ncbi:hypothetical protein PR048_009838 [Dryococelus australis]|uniref:Uncharacterized protein n=1 Tax=Dryococelus australis TaxID=614101 RepID=A0ABQ9I0Z7_9NEOP|nr:hypothetical protein PR048_009838 [Dryococelus australis]